MSSPDSPEGAHPGQEVDVRDAASRVKKMLTKWKGVSELSADDLFKESYGQYADPASYPQRAKRLTEQLGVSPATIYYPGSNIDLSFAKLFPDSRVIHTDLEQDVMDKMAAAGYEATVADMKTFVPDEPAAVVAIFNAGYLEQDQLKRIMQPNGVVIVNNYHWAATYMRDNCPGFSLQAAILQDMPDTITTDFNLAELGQLPQEGEMMWPPHSETIFAFKQTGE